MADHTAYDPSEDVRSAREILATLAGARKPWSGPSEARDRLLLLDEAANNWRLLFAMSTVREAFDSESKSALAVLMQGLLASLLAAYIIGFVSATSSALGTEHSLTQLTIDAVLPGTVSLSFALVSTAAFLGYQESVVASPAWSDDRTWLDCLVPLSQAVLFGIAILSPELLSGCLGVYAIVLFRRTAAERSRLIEVLYGAIDRKIEVAPRLKQIHGDGRVDIEVYRTSVGKEVRRTVAQAVGSMAWCPMLMRSRGRDAFRVTGAVSVTGVVVLVALSLYGTIGWTMPLSLVAYLAVAEVYFRVGWNNASHPWRLRFELVAALVFAAILQGAVIMQQVSSELANVAILAVVAGLSEVVVRRAGAFNVAGRSHPGGTQLAGVVSLDVALMEKTCDAFISVNERLAREGV